MSSLERGERPVDGARLVAIGPGEAGLRLDVALARLLPGESRSSVRRLIDGGMILMGGRPVKPAAVAEEGWVLSVNRPPPAASPLQPEDIPLPVLYEDEHLVVVNKPAGLVVHPAPGHSGGTLVNALLHRCRDLSGVGGVQRPGIVHRLDRGTSGVMVAAKTDAAHRHLAAQFKGRQVAKTYLALVWDNVARDEGEIDLPIGRDRRDRQKMSARTNRPREALTRFRVLRRLGWATLLEVSPRTGRTHQIRVHLAHFKHPLVGDPVYGRRGDRAGSGSEAGRPLLHAWKLSFRHPADGRPLSFTAPPPDDLDVYLGGDADAG